MNLNDYPTQSQLMQLIAKCDNSFNHALWVSKEGDVNIQPFKLDESPALWQIRNSTQVQFRCELIPASKGKLGVKASLDKKWIAKLFHTLALHWERKTLGYAGLL